MIIDLIQTLRPVAEPSTTAIRLPAGSGLQAGEQVEGRVVAATDRGQLTIRFARMELQMQSNLPIATGDTLRFQVVRQRDQLLLQLMSQMQSTAGAERRESTPLQSGATTTAATPGTPAAAPAAGSGGATAVAQAIRTALPVATSLPPLLANLMAIGRGEGPAATPRQIVTLAGQFIDQLPQLQRVTGSEGLQQAVRDSGLFLEGRLAQLASGSGQPVDGDLKANLLRLLNQLQRLDLAAPARATAPPAAAGSPAPSTTPTAPAPTAAGVIAQTATSREGTAGTPPQPQPPPPPQPATAATALRPPMHQAALQAQPAATATLGDLDPTAIRGELVRETQGALARLQLSQLATLRGTQEGAHSGNPQWLLDLPIRNGQSVDTIQVRIESRGAARARAGGRSWSLSLALDLGTLGPVDARVTFGEGGDISTLFWSERSATVALIQHNLPILQRSLSESGLQVGRLAAFEGCPPSPEAGEQAAGRAVLLDLEA